MDIAAELIICESSLPLSSVKIFIELINSNQLKISAETAGVIYAKLLQEISHYSIEQDRFYPLVRLISLILEREEDLLIQFKNEFIPSSLEIFIDSDYVHSCNLHFDTNFPGVFQEADEKCNLHSLLRVLSSRELLQLVCRGELCDRTFNLFLHLSVSSKNNCLKLVLICLRALSHSLIAGNDYILNLIYSLHRGEIQSAENGLCFFLLTTLYSTTEKDYTLQTYHTTDIFWIIIQQGLVHSDSLTRKQSIFLLKKGAGLLTKHITPDLPTCVGFLRSLDPQSEVCENWLTIIYLFETYEETQIHILRSSLPLLYSLANFVKKEEELVHTNSIHYSWLLILYLRILSHESRLVQSWGLKAVLDCPISHCTQPEVVSFITESLIVALNVSSIFISNPEMIGSITTFLSRFFSGISTTDAGQNLAKLVTNLTLLSDIPLFYLSYALSSIISLPIVSRDVILALQRLFSRNVLAHSRLLKTAIKSFLIRFITRCINPGSCCWIDIFMLLTHIEVHTIDSSEYTEYYHLINSLVNSRVIEGSPFILFILNHFINSYLGTEHKSSYELSRSLDGEHLVSDEIYSSSGREIYAPYSLMDFQFPTKTGCVIAQLALTAATICEQIPKKMIEDTISPVIQLLLCVTTHPYMPTEQTTRVFELTKQILSTAKVSDVSSYSKAVSNSLYSPLVKNLTELALYLVNQERSNELEHLLSIIHDYEISNESSPVQHWDDLAREISRQCHEELKLTLSPEKIDLTANTIGLVSILASVLSKTVLNEKLWLRLSPTVQTLINSINLLPDNKNIITSSTEDRVRYINAILQVTSLSHSKHYLLSMSEMRLFYSLKDLSTITNYSGLLYILNILSFLLPPLFNEHTDLCRECVFECWRGVKEESADSDQMQMLLPAFFRSCISRELLTCFHSEVITTALMLLIDQVIEWGIKRMSVIHLLVVHLVDVWSSTDGIASISIYWRQIIGILFTTPELSKSVKQLDNALSFGLLLDEYDFSNWRGIYNQNMSQLYIVELLGVLTDTNIAQLDGYPTLVERFIDEFLRIEIERSKIKQKFCSFNSRLHREKIRTWQLVLILLASLRTTYTSLSVFDNEKLLLLLLTELLPTNVQPSVRCYIEWSAVLLLSNCGILDSTLLKEMRLFSTAPTTRLPFVYISYVSILSLVLKNMTIPSTLLIDIVALLIGMMSSSNTQLRHVSLDLLREIKKLPVSEEIPLLAPILLYLPDMSKLIEPSNWTFTIHPEDLNLFYLLQQLPDQFELVTRQLGLEELLGRNWDNNHTVPLGNERYHQKFNPKKKKNNIEVETRVDLESKDLMQKKIMPWEIMDGEFSIGLEGRYCESNSSHKRGELILIASLIDKPTNLGGMCRTCEVFGAATLVISDIKLMEDRSFTSLSVSAERWMSIEQVKTSELSDYVALLKEQGYKLVGIEQTPNSISLQDFSFPKRSALIVGHEKFGIPIELLEIVDYCVQIPQFGIIRSLNVHVSSAISIWHYTTQHSINSSDSINS